MAGGGSGETLAWCVRSGVTYEISAKDLPAHAEKLEKFVEDVKLVALLLHEGPYNPLLGIPFIYSSTTSLDS